MTVATLDLEALEQRAETEGWDAEHPYQRSSREFAPYSRNTLDFCRALPKCELNAHLNGTVRDATIQELAGTRTLNGKPLSLARLVNLTQQMSPSLAECFQLFDVLHSLTTDHVALRRITREAIEDMVADGVVYAEIRTTPKCRPERGVTKVSYMQSVLDGIDDYFASTGAEDITVRLLLSIRREQTRQEMMETVMLAVALRDRGVMGVDLTGNPTEGEWEDWQEALDLARQQGLKVTLEAGETLNPVETAAMLAWGPDRLGHCCCLTPDLERRLLDLHIPLEVCLTSNVVTRSVVNLRDHEFSKLHKQRHPLVLCTADSGVLNTCLSREYAIAAQAFNLTERQLQSLALNALDYAFVDELEKVSLQQRMQTALRGPPSVVETLMPAPAAFNMPTSAGAATEGEAGGAPPQKALKQAPALDVDAFFSLEGAARQQGSLRSLAGQFAGIPGIVSLSGGFPPPTLFPFAGLTLHLKGGGSVDIAEPSAVTCAQQYNFSLRGHAPLLAWAEAHMAAMHAPPPAARHQVLITNGGNHTLEMIFALFMDRGDSLLLEEYSYPVVTGSLAQPKGLHAIPVPIDEGGIIPERLEQVLAELRAAVDAGTSSVPFPKLLYTIPTAHNPTGCTILPERRAAVYRLCQRYNLLLVEDDPYFYLQYRQGAAAVPGLPGLRLSGSYLSQDTDGRVLRVDSFAKFLMPGLRLGWVTAHPRIADKLTMIIQSHTVGPCSLSQVVAAETLRAWGDEGLDAHLRSAQTEYAQRVATIAVACERHLTGLAQWRHPTAGMFLWLRLLTVQDSTEVWDALKAAKVVLLPGRTMHCRSWDPSFRSPNLRASFSNVPVPELEEGMLRLAQVLRDHAAATAAPAEAGGGGDAAAATGVLRALSDTTDSQGSGSGMLLG
ncbi:Adenosine deaminase [Micractinium conductrix]|uniref:Adenosine deaminase n=1 Tax=Micractinium conductrix TaxID=554055 RepID=A0A2P6VKR7_9CHLO|nr:Adenosine deaminase [Micractinium conductrix]|eukprot:PSC74701.1 Adenosine deaminase [Micractinium conductrix]